MKISIAYLVFHIVEQNSISKLQSKYKFLYDFDYNLINKNRNLVFLSPFFIKMEIEFRECSHKSYGSPYPKEKVPEIYFRKNIDNAKSISCKTCHHCREYIKKYLKKTKDQRKKKEIEKKKILETNANPEFGYCNSKTHDKNAPYARHEVPKGEFYKIQNDFSSKLFNTCAYCREKERKRGKDMRKKFEKEKNAHDDSGEFGYCPSDIHDKFAPYHRDKIPKSNFYENEDDTTSKLFEICLYCRQKQYAKIVANKNRFKDKIIEFEKKLENSETKYMFCLYRQHHKVSTYENAQVPIELFYKDPNDLKSKIFKYCVDCRIYVAKILVDYRHKNEQEAKTKELHWCRLCKKMINHSQRASNNDGSLSTLCVKCHELCIKKYYKHMSKNYRNVKFEMMKKYNCGCQRCKRIFLKPDSGSLCIKKYETFLNDNNERVMNLDDKIITMKELLENHRDLIELSAIDLDHLTEQEQRERGLLLLDEKFEGKIDCVSQITNLHDMERESKKTQNLCIECHIIVTIERNQVRTRYTGQRLQKINYVKELKSKGCSSCGYINNDLSRYLRCDHIDPLDKNCEISVMVDNSGFSFEDLIKECNKTRILCGFCDRIHTQQQFDNGIINKKLRQFYFRCENDIDIISDEFDDINIYSEFEDTDTDTDEEFEQFYTDIGSDEYSNHFFV